MRKRRAKGIILMIVSIVDDDSNTESEKIESSILVFEGLLSVRLPT